MAPLTVTVVANACQLGGGELDLCTQMRSTLAMGCRVVFRPATPLPIHRDIPIPSAVEVGPQFGTAPLEPTDVLFLLANNTIMGVDGLRSAWEQAARAARWRFLLLNWQVRDAATPWFARLWDRVGFLSTTLQGEWCDLTGRSEDDTCIHAPAVELEPYLAMPPREYVPVVFIRHSVAAKWPPDTLEIMRSILTGCPSARFDLMGLPDDFAALAPHIAPGRYQPAWAESRFSFLRRGSVYFYPLRYGYTDQGPRVIVEAMAAGLAVIADNRDGATDRVTPETGWLCNTHEGYAGVAAEIRDDPGVLQRKGLAARERARSQFQPERWMMDVLPMVRKEAVARCWQR